MSGSSASSKTASMQAVNAQARQLVLQQGVRSRLMLASQTVSNPASGNNVINIPLQNSGLITGFLIRVDGTIANNGASGSASLTPTYYCLQNVLTNVTLVDYNNYQRINTDGVHLSNLMTIKRRRPFGTMMSPSGINDRPFNQPDLFSYSSSIAPGSTGTIRTYYYVPLTPGKYDLTGALVGMQINNQATLALTINPAPVANGTDATFAVYNGNAGAWTSVTVTVYQDTIVSIPQDANGQYILPPLDINQVYELKKQVNTGLAVGSDYYIQVPNFRQFRSAMVLFDNGGGENNGTDLNYIAMTTANFFTPYKVDAIDHIIRQTEMIDYPFPPGLYVFDWSDKPIDTAVYGNQALIFNPSVVNTGSQLITYWEDTGLASLMLSGASFVSQ